MKARLALLCVIVLLLLPIVARAQIVDPVTGALYVELAPAGATTIISAAAEASHVLKAAPGRLFSLYAVAGTTAGYLMVFDATSAPADGAVTPSHCAPVGAGQKAELSVRDGLPEAYFSGITAVFSTTGCFTKTASATAFFHGVVQ